MGLTHCQQRLCRESAILMLFFITCWPSSITSSNSRLHSRVHSRYTPEHSAASEYRLCFAPQYRQRIHFRSVSGPIFTGNHPKMQRRRHPLRRGICPPGQPPAHSEGPHIEKVHILPGLGRVRRPGHSQRVYVHHPGRRLCDRRPRHLHHFPERPHPPLHIPDAGSPARRTPADSSILNSKKPGGTRPPGSHFLCSVFLFLSLQT